jgi:hypothetical protein
MASGDSPFRAWWADKLGRQGQSLKGQRRPTSLTAVSPLAPRARMLADDKTLDPSVAHTAHPIIVLRR